MNTLFVTGTDTEVGKTFVSCALLTLFESINLPCAAFKPVAAGMETINGSLVNPDTFALQQHSSASHTLEQISPFSYAAAIAPHIAAQQTKKTVTIAAIQAYYQQHFSTQPATLIEGAGGWEVPLNEQESFSDLALTFAGPIILVVDIKLGCINHALLSARNILSRGGKLIGWIANNKSAYHHAKENILALEQRIQAPLLGELPPLKQATEACAYLNQRQIVELLVQHHWPIDTSTVL